MYIQRHIHIHDDDANVNVYTLVYARKNARTKNNTHLYIQYYEKKATGNLFILMKYKDKIMDREMSADMYPSYFLTCIVLMMPGFLRGEMINR